MSEICISRCRVDCLNSEKYFALSLEVSCVRPNVTKTSYMDRKKHAAAGIQFGGVS